VYRRNGGRTSAIQGSYGSAEFVEYTLKGTYH